MTVKQRDLESLAPDIMGIFDKLNSDFDLKNAGSVDHIIKNLGEYQNSLINVGLIVVTLIIAGVMFNDHRTKDQGLRLQMSQAQDKIEAVKARDAAIQNFNNFKSSLPKKLSEFDLITLISDYAKLYHVTISSLSPAESQDKGLYDVINVNFDAESDDFKGMMLFLRTIEKSNLSIRINSWSGKEEPDGKINFDAKIRAVVIHI
jgi:hypothetical protein